MPSDIEIDVITGDLPIREVARLAYLNDLKLRGIQEMLQDMGLVVGQLWTGVNSTGSATQPGTGAERTNRRWRKDVPLGASAADYTDWTPIVVGAGFTIWKIGPDSYSHNDFNSVFLDGQPFRNTGEAASLALSGFTKVLFYDGSAFTDNTDEASSEWGTEFTLLEDTADYTYVGAGSAFGGVSFNFHTPGGNISLDIEYWNGSAWAALTKSSDTTEDTDINVQWVQNGSIGWTAPGDWAQTTVDGTNAYWVRFSTSSTPTRTPKAYFVSPTDSVITLLQLSRKDLEDMNFAFCSFDDELYVALPSEGDPDYEGTQFVRSGSSASKLQDYFASNHKLEAFYEDRFWTGGDVTNNMREISAADRPDAEIQVGEKIWWHDTDDDKVYLVYRSPGSGAVVDVELT